MLKAEYLGTSTYKVDEFKHLDSNQLLVTNYLYWIRKNVPNELVVNAVVGGGFFCSCKKIKAVLKQILNELLDNYNAFTEKNSYFCIKLSLNTSAGQSIKLRFDCYPGNTFNRLIEIAITSKKIQFKNFCTVGKKTHEQSFKFN